ncbi:MAG: UDP-N-acetylglucosamine 2-epimerase (non-hydrolyzing) [Elusimicrobiota bacterium]
MKPRKSAKIRPRKRSKVLVVVGTRPDAIKMAPVLRRLKELPELRVRVLGTAQHRGMLDQMLAAFKLKLDHDLDLMTPGQSPERILSAALKALPGVYLEEAPDLVLVQGDTVTALAAALAAFFMRLPVGHVEAGLRSHDLSQPFPEEMNRTIIDRIASLHFCPTAGNRKNLVAEGVSAKNAYVTGNTVVDALEELRKQPRPWEDRKLKSFLQSSRGKRLLVFTCHRRESFGAPMRRMVAALDRLVRRRKDLAAVFPVHPNPRVRACADALRRSRRLLLCRPLSYNDFIRLASGADVILTDSGGVQEEAPTLGVPAVVMREKTDRPESVRSGHCVLAGTRTRDIVRRANALLRRKPRPSRRNPFGDGRSARRIAVLARRFLREKAGRI